MSTVAWRGKIIAADTRGVADGRHLIRHLNKLFYGEGWVMGAVGNSTDISQFVEWFELGRDKTKLPHFISYTDRDKADFEAIVISTVVNEEGVFLWNQWFSPLPIDDPFWAIGSGAEVALGAMHMGADALQAVEVAAKVDCYTGGRIDSLTFKP